MKADYLSYKRATSVSLLGLALQLGLGLTLLIYSFLAVATVDGSSRRHIDDSALTGALFILLGSVVWLLLAIVFDQHRRERIEQMELEAMNAAGGGHGSSAFSEGADEFRVAHKRLVGMHKFLVPTVSLLYAAALAGVGVWRWFVGMDVVRKESFPSTDIPGVIISLSLATAFIGFVFARYVAGMAKQPVWAHLRAGAGVMVGAALFGLLTAISQFIDKFGPPDAERYLHVVWPAVMVLLAGEVVISFIARLYSPRKPGEFPRAALDSQILSFAAAPDRIAASIGEALNYQFGFDVTGNWFYQLLARRLSVLVLLGIVVVWLLSCIAVVEPDEQGLRVFLGRLVQSKPLEPGVYLKWLWPFERVDTFRTTAARRIDLGSAEPKLKDRAILWTNDHGVEEVPFAVRPAAQDAVSGGGGEPGVQGSDFAFANLELPLYYSVEDYAKFDALGSPEEREDLLKAVARREAFRLVATMSIDDVLGSGREALTKELRVRVAKRFDDLNEGRGAGVKILFVGVEAVHPPQKTAASFEQVVSAYQRKASNIEDARKLEAEALIKVAGSVEKAETIVKAIDALGNEGPGGVGADRGEKQRRVEELLVKAGGEAAVTIQKARADRWSKHMAARSQAEAYAGRIAAYQQAPEVYAARTYFETLLEALKDSRVYLIVDEGHTHVNTNLEDVSAGGASILQKKKDE